MISRNPSPKVRSDSTRIAFRNCRSCYNHMGGLKATMLFEILLKRKLIMFEGNAAFVNSRKRLPLRVIPEGIAFLRERGVPLPDNIKATACLDGTEMRPHLAGQLGDALLVHMLENGWVDRNNDFRTLTLNSGGIEFLRKVQI